VLRQGASKGAGKARNRAAPLLEGDLVAYVDADDTFEPAAFEAAVKSLQGRPDLDLLFLPYGIAGADEVKPMWVADRRAWARGAAASTAADRKAAALDLVNYPWNRVGRREALADVWCDSVRF